MEKHLYYIWRLKVLLISLFILLIIGCATHSVEVVYDKVIVFKLKVDKNCKVEFASNLNNYIPVNSVWKSGEWITEIPYVKSEDIFYYYIINGKIFIPDCKIKEKDDFGGENCVFEKK